mgnify:CR=1 FL=1
MTPTHPTTKRGLMVPTKLSIGSDKINLMIGDNVTETTDENIKKLNAVLDMESDAELIDETFYVWETRFGLWSTMTQEGRKMLTGLTREAVVDMTRWHLKCEQEGWPPGSVRVINNGIVGGKL